ncbi:MAG: CvpA family protein [Clostridia bacterium]|nr:CvpA family protein [Clostridia bacterium]
MAVYFTWGAIGVLLLFLIIGFVAGLVRGLKRSSLHILFLIVSVALAFFITKPITSAVLKFTINYEGSAMPLSDVIIRMISEQFDLSSFSGATTFAASLPMAIVSPILFIVITVLVYFVFDMIYLIVARISFGKKKKDFETNKPRRAYGAVIGMVEGFLLLFVMFAPISSLANTYAEIVSNSTPAQSVSIDTDGDGNSNRMKTLGETITESLPPAVNEAILAYNNCVIGKIAGAGGLDNALFDGLSSFNVDEEKINFRKEVITLTNVYDEVAITYNAINDGDFADIDLTVLKAELETFLNNGIFKAVITDMVNTVIVEFETLKEELNLDALPEVVQDVINDLHTRFTSQDFNAHEYLKSDILKVVDIFDEIIKEDLITAFKNAPEGIEGTLEVVNDNSEAVKKVAKDFLGLNIVSDTFNALGKFGSQMFAEAFENDKNLEIGLNIDVQKKDELVDELLAIIDDIDAVNQEVGLFDLVASEDIMKSITEIENIETSLIKIGKVLDDVRNLSILVLPVEDGVRTEKQYVFDNILETLNIKLLGDVVYVQGQSSFTQETLNSYEKFFGYVGKPIENMKDMGLLEEISSFDALLENKILPALEINKSALSGIMTPFYQLKIASFDTTDVDTPNIKTMIFDSFIDMIGSSVQILDMESVKTIAQEAESTTGTAILVWNDELTKLGTLLNLLDRGEIEVDGTDGKENKTYLQYILMQDADLTKLLTEMLNDTDDTLFANVLDNVFTATMFGNLKTQVFTEIDKLIGEITGVIPQTDLTNLDATKDQTIDTIEKLLEIATAEETNLDDLDLELAGRILDLLKVNAYNDSTDDNIANGTKDGVFNNIFANLIWYMTSDNLNGVDYTGKTPYEQTAGDKAYLDVKAYLNVANNDEYYTINYASKMAELEDVIAFANALMTKLDGKSLDTPENTALYLAAAKEVVDKQVETTTREATLTVIGNTAKFLTNKGEDLLEGEDLETRYTVKAGIETLYAEDAEMATELKKLMGVNDLPELPTP